MGEYNDDEYDDRAQAGRGGRVSERIINFIESADGSVSLVTLTREEAETAIAAILAAREGQGLDVCPDCGTPKSAWATGLGMGGTREQAKAIYEARDRPGLDVERVMAVLTQPEFRRVSTEPYGDPMVTARYFAREYAALAQQTGKP